jgi:predicted O-methyltransferase YrrM
METKMHDGSRRLPDQLMQQLEGSGGAGSACAHAEPRPIIAAMEMLRKLPFSLKLKTRLQGLRLVTSEAFLPAGYYVQMRPAFASEQWEADRKRYDELHDWDNFRDGGNRVLQAHLLLDMVKDYPAGDYAELGTYQGNYARIIYSRMAGDATLYCFDTFAGFPEASVRKEAQQTGLQVSTSAFSDTSQARVVQTIAGQLAASRLVLRAGEFPETFAGLENRRWRFVLLDADLYAPIKAGLELFWPRLVPGGIILIHDYLGWFKGAKQAVHEFCDPLGIVPIPWPDRVGTAVIAKPKL